VNAMVNTLWKLTGIPEDGNWYTFNKEEIFGFARLEELQACIGSRPVG